MKKILLLFAVLLCSAQLMAQGRRVTGKVVGPDGEPLIGVSIVEKGTTNGVSGDVDGNYSIEVHGQNPVLVFSFLGYESQEIALAAGRTRVDVTMADDAQIVDEVVVVG